MYMLSPTQIDFDGRHLQQPEVLNVINREMIKLYELREDGRPQLKPRLADIHRFINRWIIHIEIISAPGTGRFPGIGRTPTGPLTPFAFMIQFIEFIVRLYFSPPILSYLTYLLSSAMSHVKIMSLCLSTRICYHLRSHNIIISALLV